MASVRRLNEKTIITTSVSLHYICYSPSEGIITVINKWSGEVCSISSGDKGERRLLEEFIYECEYENYPADIKLP
jgi:hypothetical protein